MKKISLSKETVRTLNDRKLNTVRGGGTNSCDCSGSPECIHTKYNHDY